MSVKVCDRSQGRLEVLTKAMELAVHTIRICDNDKVFPKRHRLSVTADIIKEVKWLPKLINRANKSKGEKRAQLQEQAVDLVDDIEVDMQIAYDALKPNITERKLDYWLGLLLAVRVLIKAWIKSDARNG